MSQHQIKFQNTFKQIFNTEKIMGIISNSFTIIKRESL